MTRVRHFVFGEKKTLGSSVLRNGCDCPGHRTLRDTEGRLLLCGEVWEGVFQARCRPTKFQFGASAHKRESPMFACSRKDTASLYKVAAGVVDGTTVHPKLAAVPGSVVCGYWLWSHE